VNNKLSELSIQHLTNLTHLTDITLSKLA